MDLDLDGDMDLVFGTGFDTVDEILTNGFATTYEPLLLSGKSCPVPGRAAFWTCYGVLWSSFGRILAILWPS